MNYDCSKCPVTLESFCGKRSYNYNLALPRRVGDYVYATDGSICVRVWGAHYAGPEDTQGRFPDVTSIPWGEEVTEWGPVPAPLPCDTCENSRVILYECDSFTEDHDVLMPCPDCRVEIHGRRMAWRIVEPLTRFAPEGPEVGKLKKDNRYAPLPFRFTLGDAMVMPRAT